MNTETMREMFEDSEEWKAWSNGLKKDCPEFAENYIQAIKNNVEKIVARAVAKEREEQSKKITLTKALIMVAQSISPPTDMRSTFAEEVGAKFREFDKKVLSITQKWDWQNDDLELQDDGVKKYVDEIINTIKNKPI